MNNEYIIINKTAIQKRIEELEIEISYHHKKKEHLVCKELSRIKLELEELLSQSTPLIPEIEKAFDTGSDYGSADALFWSTDRMSRTEYEAKQDKQDYISNLKLNI